MVELDQETSDHLFEMLGAWNAALEAQAAETEQADADPP